MAKSQVVASISQRDPRGRGLRSICRSLLIRRSLSWVATPLSFGSMPSSTGSRSSRQAERAARQLSVRQTISN
eukprot:8410416-Heterocapsa_arctica.AAC.1